MRRYNGFDLATAYRYVRGDEGLEGTEFLGVEIVEEYFHAARALKKR
jgi:hypothetical protein